MRGDAYSQGLRERVFAASDEGERVGEVAELLRVSVWGRAHKPPKLTPFYAAIRAQLPNENDTTIEALRAWLLATHQVSAKRRALAYVAAAKTGEQDRPDFAARSAWR